MKFSIHGPFELPRDSGLIDTTASSRRLFWEKVDESVPGLPDACGCYIFVIKAKRGALPWYVGLTEKNSFRFEAIGLHQVDHYNHALARKIGVKPQLFFLAKQTPTERFAKPSANYQPDVEFLETFMFGIALNRNADLRNAKNTRFLRNLVVPSIINSPRRPPTLPERHLKKALGI
jgi:hypothetical protein